MADYTPVYSAGIEPFSVTTSAAVTGGQVLEWTGASTVGPHGRRLGEGRRCRRVRRRVRCPGHRVAARQRSSTS
jgi:hypothetical protein